MDEDEDDEEGAVLLLLYCPTTQPVQYLAPGKLIGKSSGHASHAACLMSIRSTAFPVSLLKKPTEQSVQLAYTVLEEG